eukprot:jgi/Bigna1/143058/aug1.75_g17766
MVAIQAEYEKKILKSVQNQEKKIKARRRRENSQNTHKISSSEARKKIEQHRMSCAQFLIRKESAIEAELAKECESHQSLCDRMQERAVTAMILRDENCLLEPSYLFKYVVEMWVSGGD